MTRVLLTFLVLCMGVVYGVSPASSENYLTLYIRAPEGHEVTVRHGDKPMGKRVDPDRWEVNIPFEDKGAVTFEVRYVGEKQEGAEWVSPSKAVKFEVFGVNGLPNFSSEQINWGGRQYKDARKWVLDVKVSRMIQPLSFEVNITKQLVPLAQVGFPE